MHVCFVTYGPWAVNAGHLRPRHLGPALLDRGVQVSYLVDDLPENRDLGLDPRAQVILVRKPRSLLQLYTRRHALVSMRPDTVHLLNPHAKSLALVAGLDKFHVLAEWDEPPVFRSLGATRHLLELALDRWLRRRADSQVAITRWLQDLFAEKYGVVVPYIPHASYLGPFPPDLATPYDEPAAVYLGTLTPEWDHDILFRALELLANRAVRPRVDFIGAGPDLQHWKSYCQSRGLSHVRFQGWCDGAALQARLRHAHVLLFPIRDKQLNRARCPSKLFAYAQARRPLITMRVGEVPEILGDGPVYVSETVEAFADALERAMAADLPDVDYGVERHSYADRAEKLMPLLGTQT